MEALWQDIRYEIRTLLNSPGFTAVAVLILALGIGANTAIFSVINSVLLRPLPFRDPERLVQLWETEAAPGTYPFAGPDYIDWQAQNRTLEATCLYTWGSSLNASGAGEPVSALVVRTQANFFSVLGVQPALGRTFAAGEDQEGEDRVAILSYGFWQRHFGGDKGVIGKPVELNSETYAVIGVMPRWFNHPPATDIWTPLDMSLKNLGIRGSHSFRAFGRLKPGVSAEQALADLTIIAKRLEDQYPDSNEKVGAAVIPLKEQITRSSREQLLILLGAVALVLLIACANVANLLLSRSIGRQREIALRAALGAGRWRVVRQLLTESVLLALAGSALGLLAAGWCVNLIQSAQRLPIPRENAVRIDATVLLFSIAVGIFVGILFGLAPALQASKFDLNEELKSSAQAAAGPAGSRGWLRDALVVGEIAVSLALLVGAGLLLRSFARMRNAEIGVQSQNVLTMGINLPGRKYATLTARREFFDRLLDRIRQTPGIQAASVSTQIPLEGGSNGYITVAARDDAAIKNQLFEWHYTTQDYFQVFGIPFLQGRNFTPQEIDRVAEVNLKINELFAAPSPPKQLPKDLSFVAVINRVMARLVWPGQDPIGKLFKIGDFLPVTVIGVVGDVKERGIRGDVVPQAYFPLTGALDNRDWGMRVLVKTSIAPMGALAAIRNHVKALDSSLAVLRPRTMNDVISDAMQDTSLQTLLLSVFAGLAVLLAAVGLYSVMAYLVTQRTHEMGIRMALGAQRNDVLRLVLGHGSRLTAAGVGAGIAAALALTRLIRTLLFGVSANDFPTFAAVAILLTLVALAACYVPAHRATRVDPISALRCQ
jgi:putative ABC transport system permease protein